MRVKGNPLEPCTNDPGFNGSHEWEPLLPSGTGPPRPNARHCVNCDAVDYGPEGKRVTVPPSGKPKFPANKGEFQDIVSHDANL